MKQAALSRWLVLGLVLWPSISRSQTNERVYESLEFRVVTPGARAVGMGKTFVGIADDATAAASNPAGLSNLFDPEVSFEWSGAELRHNRMATVNQLALYGPAPGQLLQFQSHTAEPTFASFVTPLPDRHILRNITIAVFYNSLQRYAETFDLPRNEGTLDGRGYCGDIDVSVKAFGGGGAILVGPRLSIGGSLTVQQLRDRTISHGYNNSCAEYRNGSETNDSDRGVSGQIGVLYRPTSSFSFGAAYLKGTTFVVDTEVVGVFSPENSPPLPARPVRTFPGFENSTRETDYRVPDRFTVGGSVRATPTWTIVADFGLVKYSQRITKRFLIVDFLGQPDSSGLDRLQYYLDDAVEIHLGAENRRKIAGHSVSFRFGYFTNPDHQMRFDLPASNRSGQARSQAIQFNTYRPGTVSGVAAGAGLVFNNRVQIDSAFSLSANERQFILSTVMRFPR